MDKTMVEERKHFAIILGQVLQKLRIDREMSLLAVAEQAKISEATMCRYEQGARVGIPLHQMTIQDVNKVANKVRVPDLFSAYKISHALGVTLDDLMARCTALVVAAKKYSQEQKGDKKNA